MLFFAILKVFFVIPFMESVHTCSMNDCDCLMDYISCYNQVIRDKLSFTAAEREKVTYLDLRNMEMNRVPDLEKAQWPKLKVL